MLALCASSSLGLADQGKFHLQPYIFERVERLGPLRGPLKVPFRSKILSSRWPLYLAKRLCKELIRATYSQGDLLAPL